MTERIAFQQFHALFGKLQIFRNDNFIVNDFKLAHMPRYPECISADRELPSLIQKKSRLRKRGRDLKLGSDNS